MVVGIVSWLPGAGDQFLGSTRITQSYVSLLCAIQVISLLRASEIPFGSLARDLRKRPALLVCIYALERFPVSFLNAVTARPWN
jgi:hypothetical protein